MVVILLSLLLMMIQGWEAVRGGAQDVTIWFQQPPQELPSSKHCVTLLQAIFVAWGQGALKNQLIGYHTVAQIEYEGFKGAYKPCSLYRSCKLANQPEPSQCIKLLQSTICCFKTLPRILVAVQSPRLPPPLRLPQDILWYLSPASVTGYRLGKALGGRQFQPWEKY